MTPAEDIRSVYSIDICSTWFFHLVFSDCLSGFPSSENPNETELANLAEASTLNMTFVEASYGFIVLCSFSYL